MIGLNARYDSRKQLKMSSILNRKILMPMMFASISFTALSFTAMSFTAIFFTAIVHAAPAAPSGVRIDVYLDSTVELIWDQADKSDPVSGYELNRNGTRMWLGAVTSYVDSEISPGITNNYTVVAVDESGARSADSRAVSVSNSCSNSGGSCTSFSFAESRPSNRLGASGLELIDDVTLPTYSNAAAELIWPKNDTTASYDTSRGNPYLRGKDRQGSFDSARSSSHEHKYKIVAIDVGGNQLGDVMIAERRLGGASRFQNARSEGAAKYDVYRNGHWIATTNGRRFHDAGLSQNSYYEYTVYKIEDGRSQLLGSATIATRGQVR